VDGGRRRPAALVTGAARGVGAHTARLLAQAGWAVLLLDACAPDPAVPYPLASPGDLEAATAACRAAAGCRETVAAVTGDVRRQEDLDAAVAAAAERFGGLDAAVAGAGVLVGGSTGWLTTDTAWSVNLDVNLTGAWRLARAAVPALLARPRPRRGRVVMVASAAALGGLPRLSAYSAAKHGVLGLTRSLAAELAAEGITVNAVCPGSTDTPMLSASAALYGLSGAQRFAHQQPLGRLLEPAEVAAAIAWLCSEAASGITGAALPVDGGMTAVSSWEPGRPDRP
jgi:SDR family mycofactocin-dependent oxidoreductase